MSEANPRRVSPLHQIEPLPPRASAAARRLTGGAGDELRSAVRCHVCCSTVVNGWWQVSMPQSRRARLALPQPTQKVPCCTASVARWWRRSTCRAWAGSAGGPTHSSGVWLESQTGWCMVKVAACLRSRLAHFACCPVASCRLWVQESSRFRTTVKASCVCWGRAGPPAAAARLDQERCTHALPFVSSAVQSLAAPAPTHCSPAAALRAAR